MVKKLVGKWKRTLDKKIIFEGEFINEVRWKGKIIVYNDYDKLIFEGEYIGRKKYILITIKIK